MINAGQKRVACCVTIEMWYSSAGEKWPGNDCQYLRFLWQLFFLSFVPSLLKKTNVSSYTRWIKTRNTIVSLSSYDAKSKKIYPVRILGMLFMGPVIQKVRCLNKALSVKLNELIWKSTKHSSFETAIPFESNILFGELLCKFTMATCSLSSLFRLTSLCGARSIAPHDLQCITLRKCNKDVHPHLK